MEMDWFWNIQMIRNFVEAVKIFPWNHYLNTLILIQKLLKVKHAGFISGLALKLLAPNPT